MKRILCLTASLALTLLTGCVVMSVYPYYTAKDIKFDPALLGVWVDPDQTNATRESWTFERLGEQTYRLTVLDNDKQTEFDARLFQLKGYTFLDCLPRERTDYTAPCHLLLRVDRLQPVLEMRLLNYEWLGKFIEKQPKAIRHVTITKADDKSNDAHNGQMFVLTADTAELQKFVLKHTETKEAWKDVLTMRRQ